MTAAEKTTIAQFLELAAAVSASGYRRGETEYHFTDDPAPGEQLPAGGELPQKNTSLRDTVPVSIYGSSYMKIPPDTVLPAESSPQDSLETVVAEVQACTMCRLAQTRKNAVPGEGVQNPLVMVIGEGPGADEDSSGRPFVGKAGQLLDKMLAAIDLSRETNCFIANVIKCRPPANRDPQPDETAACGGFIERQIQLLKPRFILCAGRVAAHTLLGTTEPIGRLRGKITEYQTGGLRVPFIATYHPSALLRNEDLKRPAWEDLKLLRSALTGAPPETG